LQELSTAKTFYTSNIQTWFNLWREKNMYANQNQGQVQNKPTTAYWLSMIGGIIGLLASFLVVALGALGIFDTQLI
jgi:hypothetical protein